MKVLLKVLLMLVVSSLMVIAVFACSNESEANSEVQSKAEQAVEQATIVQLPTAEISINLPDGWDIVSEEGEAVELLAEERVYVLRLMPPANKDVMGLISVMVVEGGGQRSDEEFQTTLSSMAEGLLPRDRVTSSGVGCRHPKGQ